jgi:hypothetical protein
MQRFVMMYQNDAFIFGEEGDLTITSPSSSPLEGTWDVSPDGNILLLMIGSQKVPNTIKKLTNDELILAADTTRRSKYDRVLKKVEGPKPATTE